MSTPVHWRLGHTRDVPAGVAWLSEAERAIVPATARPKRHREWRLGRWTTKQLLSAHGWCDAEVLRASSGAPVVARAGTRLPVQVSISHRDELGLSCLTGPAVALGCDIEFIEPRLPVFVADYFTGGEQADVTRASPASRDTVVTAIWSAKESALKALRTGLRRDARTVEVTLVHVASADGWCPLTVRDLTDVRHLPGFWRTSDDRRYVITLVATSPVTPLLSGSISDAQ